MLTHQEHMMMMMMMMMMMKEMWPSVDGMWLFNTVQLENTNASLYTDDRDVFTPYIFLVHFASSASQPDSTKTRSTRIKAFIAKKMIINSTFSLLGIICYRRNVCARTTTGALTDGTWQIHQIILVVHSRNPSNVHQYSSASKKDCSK